MEKNNNYKKYLQRCNKEKLETIINNFNVIYNLFFDKEIKLKKSTKEKEINDIYTLLDSYIECIIKNLPLANYNKLKNIIKLKKIIKEKLTLEEQYVIEILDKYSFLSKKEVDNKSYQVIFTDIKIKINKIIKDRNTILYIEKWDKRFNLIKGIINAHGVVSEVKLLEIFHTKYVKQDNKELLNKIKCSLIINEFFNMSKSPKIIFYSKAFRNFEETKAYNENPTIIYTPEEYISFGKIDYKYNSEYKNLVKLLKKYYVFKRKDFKELNSTILNVYINQYHLNSEKSFDFLKTIVSEKFEYKNEKLEEKILSLIKKMALKEPDWSKR